MPPKAKTPAPIDRPLSRAYLREFSGWSTAYPPGLSDPTSLRLMENMMVNRDGSLRVRPGMRYLSYDMPPSQDEDFPGTGYSEAPVGTHEAFYLNDGTKAYLFAVREGDGTVTFRALVDGEDGPTVKALDAVGFSIPQTMAALAFTAATTYVKYLQIDNKIFALSNAGETMRLFTVGDNKTAKVLSSIERPAWSVADKLAVVHPDASWVTTGAPSGVRTNLVKNPSFETGTSRWTNGVNTSIARSTVGGAKVGTYALESSLSDLVVNLMAYPLRAPATAGAAGWAAGSGTTNIQAVDPNGSGWLRVNLPLGAAYDRKYINGPTVAGIVAGQSYDFQWDIAYPGSESPSQTGGVLLRWRNSSGTQIGGDVVLNVGYEGAGAENSLVASATAPAGATQVTVYLYTYPDPSSSYWLVRRVGVVPSINSFGYKDGTSGAGTYYWTGAADASATVRVPANDQLYNSELLPVTPGTTYTASAYVKRTGVARDAQIQILWYNSSPLNIGQVISVAAAVPNDWSGRISVSGAAPAGAVYAMIRVFFKATTRGEKFYTDAVQLEAAGAAGVYIDGTVAGSSSLVYAWSGTAHDSTSTETTYTTGISVPAAETATANTLISNSATTNVYNFGFFYTFENEVGESAASQVTVVRAQRRWTGWKWQTPNVSGEPSGTETSDPALACDQLVASMPQAVYDSAKAQGAVRWNLYLVAWSDQDNVPVEGLLVATKDITQGGVYGVEGWQRVTPQITDLGFNAVIPQKSTRQNYSAPSSASQGLVASDRMILVNDPLDLAKIRWSSNQQGQYTNFTAAKGGGYKTLTSGNLFIPSSVKLWQNPQSVDTLTILCRGTDGHSTSYYMAPATVSSQSEQTTVMGFEETTATPGTTSPYGVEVMNNALYQPLDSELMKSTASNYNINHKSQTDQIVTDWTRLQNKHRIISSQLDMRLYYIVDNPQAGDVPEGCMGNEIWVFDGGSDSGTWSRWLIAASSLRKIEYAGKVYMSVVRPDGIYYLDPDYDRDDYPDGGAPLANTIATRFIPWAFETNTQGANRAHDAWAHLQQLQVTFGNFLGQCEYGIRSYDLHGKPIEKKKIFTDYELLNTDGLPYDRDDYLAVRRDLREWFFFAHSITGNEDETVFSRGQINYVAYRYTPVSVNVGYEYGEVETFEYARSHLNYADRTTDSGVPRPMIETRRP